MVQFVAESGVDSLAVGIGTGIPEGDVRQAMRKGIAKVNFGKSITAPA
jgi:fructose/tagatose bisphosphate aldolase